MSEPHVSYTLKELFDRLEARLLSIEQKLDTELGHLETRVSKLESFHARFLPTSIVVVLLMTIGIVVDLFVRLTT